MMPYWLQALFWIVLMAVIGFALRPVFNGPKGHK